MDNTTHAAEALARARTGRPGINDAIVMNAFRERGIPLADIDPRGNCLTFWAWKALGRHVRKGEHGVAVLTWIPAYVTKDGERTADGVRPRSATVFHVTQTDATVTI